MTSIKFQIPQAQEVSLIIYNTLGQKVATLLDGQQRAGGHRANWNGIDSRGNAVASGIYFYQLKTENWSRTMKMMLLK